MTDTQKALTASLLLTRILPRTKSDSLQEQIVVANEHLQEGALTETDIILLSSAIELLVSSTPQNDSKEEWTQLVELLIALRKLTPSQIIAQ
mgnify:CR=1 FL=1